MTTARITNGISEWLQVQTAREKMTAARATAYLRVDVFMFLLDFGNKKQIGLSWLCA